MFGMYTLKLKIIFLNFIFDTFIKYWLYYFWFLNYFSLLLQILDLLGFICIQISDFSHSGTGQFFSTIAMTAFWFTGILLVLYLFQAVYVFNRIPWITIEFYFCLIATLSFMLTSSLAASKGVGLFTAAAVSDCFACRKRNHVLCSVSHEM